MDDFPTLKTILSLVSAPLVMLLSLVGWHHKNIYTKVSTLEDSHSKLRLSVQAHNIHLSTLSSSYKKLDKKLDSVITKLNLL